MGKQAGVLGHPIAHSLSPALHGAAYEALGLNWTYDAYDVQEHGLAMFLDHLDYTWAGVSLTMPLKVAAVHLMDYIEPMAKLVGAVNTVLVQPMGAGSQLVGANTDVYGIGAALAQVGVTTADAGVVMGGGATATSAIAALGRMGVTRPVVAVRNRATTGGLIRAATKMGLSVQVVDIAKAGDYLAQAEVAVSTIPAVAGGRISLSEVADGAVLLDAVYDPLVTPLGAAWSELGGVLVPGTMMLLHQAAEQVRLMTGMEAPLGPMASVLPAPPLSHS